jgi:hypothetical protein
MSDKADDLIPSPQVTLLKEECSLLRGELANLFAERDHLISTVGPNIQAQYALSIGIQEYVALSLDVEVRRLKATIERIQAVENQGKKANLEQIEAAVEDELEEWRAKVDALLNEIKSSEDRLKSLLSPEESRELQRLYKTLAKKLHPDLNPNLTDAHKSLWARVQKAYADGNLSELRALALLGDDLPEPAPESNQLDDLRAQRDELKKRTAAMITVIADIRNQLPFSLEAKLADKEWVGAEIRLCTERISSLASVRENLEQWLALWREKHDGI